MDKIVFRSMVKETIIEVREVDGMTYLYVMVQDEPQAKFDIMLVWDLLKEELSKANSNNSPGMERRIYEARNIYRLTQEFLDGSK